jgi:hypothetical protein
MEEIKERVASGSVTFRIAVQLASEGDVVKDMSAAVNRLSPTAGRGNPNVMLLRASGKTSSKLQ